MSILTKRSMIFLGVAIIIMSIPLVAMQFTNEVNWNTADFIIAGMLLFGAITMVEFILKRIKTKQKRNMLIIAVVVIILLLWTELAVGIFGSPLAGS